MPRLVVVVLLVVSVATGAALALSISRGHEGPDELAEVPLMAAMFVAMVWHAVRRQAAVEEAGRLAESEHRLLMAQREFVRDASHEFRTPITVARGHAELIRESGPNGQISKDVDVILDELGHLSRLSERLLLLTTAGHPGFLSPTEVPVEPFLEGLMRRWSPTADRAWQLRVECRGTVSAIRGARRRGGSRTTSPSRGPASSSDRPRRSGSSTRATRAAVSPTRACTAFRRGRSARRPTTSPGLR
jgi:signal transduction histidine kinase